MYDIFDATEMLYKALDIPEVTNAISGELCNGGRPLNSQKEDIVVNTITITTSFKPQLATSNINIHVKDIEVGNPNTKRLKEISRIVRKVFESNQFLGKSVYISDLGILQEQEQKEHYINLRIQWRIYDTKEN
ncbi:hypothetical protein SAMN05443634_105158 [Chishuiella changwenlii]|uniref:DUF3168 domain-containing protein n=1 Tax=Chishuiella changwenlii TaxID=1434701 RepID=A0A1M6X8Z0_9FLAO|nr:hypothetical protein [Chishuiella changwenlii]GGF00131.1 hypothetical protein GCM10010984_17120 [Chishuiella changwenlii]SHL02388.1 hypothetical protein SAMN05443634_105158 [Chishuiella changwenlii]